MLTGIRFHGACPHRKQGSALTRSRPPHKESQIKKMASEGPPGDGGGATGDFEEDQDENDSLSYVDHDSRAPLLGYHHCKFGTSTSDWAVRCLFISVHLVPEAETTWHFFVGGD